ncbi:MAG: CdaR family protein [Phycisphaerae bacterium]
MMSERIKTFLAVTVLTVAVWVWADLEQTGTTEAVVPVEINLPKDYRLRSVNPKQLTVTLKGPEGELQSLQTAPAQKVCRFNLTKADLQTNPLVLSAREGLDYLNDRRIAVSELRDAEGRLFDGKIYAEVTRLVEVPDVRVDVQVTGAVASAASAQPPTVTARVAEPDLEGFPESKRYVVAPVNVETIPEDLQVKREVALDRHLGGSDGIEATLEPPIVSVSARLQAAVTLQFL